MIRWDVINAVAAQIGASDYLEVGVQAGECFRRVQVERKVGVDPDPTSAATVHMSSDEYFAAQAALPRDERPSFDLVFVDGLHLAEQVIRDAENALTLLRPGGVIVGHDCDPPRQVAAGREPCGGVWCGDVWRVRKRRVIVRLRRCRKCRRRLIRNGRRSKRLL